MDPLRAAQQIGLTEGDLPSFVNRSQRIFSVGRWSICRTCSDLCSKMKRPATASPSVTGQLPKVHNLARSLHLIAALQIVEVGPWSICLLTCATNKKTRNVTPLRAKCFTSGINNAIRYATSVARLVPINQLTTYSSLAHAPNYIDRCAPSIKFYFLLRPNIGVLSRRRSNNTRWHLRIPSPRDRHCIA